MAGTSFGMALAIPLARLVTIFMAAFTMRGRFLIRVSTIVKSASVTAGIRLGSKFKSVSSTCENKSVTVERKVGNSSPTAPIIAFIAAGNAFTMFSMTGVMFLTTF